MVGHGLFLLPLYNDQKCLGFFIVVHKVALRYWVKNEFEFSGQNWNVTYTRNLWESKTSLEEILLRGGWWGHKRYASPLREAWPPLNADEVSRVGKELLDIPAGKH